MSDLTSLLQSLLKLATQYPGHTQVLVDGKAVHAVYFDAGGNGKLPSIRIQTESPGHLKPITNASEQVTSGWRNHDE